MRVLQKYEVILAIAMLIAFFMPWGRVLILTFSGYDICVQAEGYDNVIWFLPAMPIAIIMMTYFEKNARDEVIAAGIFPFAILYDYYDKMGNDLFQVMQIGAYATLVVGVLLILVGIGVIKNPSAQELSDEQ